MKGDVCARRLLLRQSYAGVMAAAAILAASPLLAVPAHAGPESAGRATVQGVYRQLIAESAPGQPHRAVTKHLLDAGSRVLNLAQPPGRGVRPGDSISVTGTMTTVASQPRLTAESTTVTSGSAASDISPTTGPADRVLVILATWTQPDAMTPDQARQRFFVENDAWFRRASYGAYGVTGDVTPWVTIAGPQNGLCLTNSAETMAQAKAAAAAIGFDSATYDRTVLYHPLQSNPDCAGLAGWAYQPGDSVWLNGVMDERTTIHEQGHNLGLGHAHSYTCLDGVGSFMPYGDSGCAKDEYGDQYDAMGGSAFVGQFSAPMKSLAGWGLNRVVDLSAGGDAVLSSLEAASGVIAVRIAAGSREYWFERRELVGADSGLPSSATDGVMVRVVDPTVSPSPGLIDLTPDGDLARTSLPHGQSWQIPGGPWVTIGAVSAAGVPISVGTAPVDLMAPGEVSNLQGRARRGNLTLSWSSPSDADFAGVTILVSTDGSDPLVAGTVLYDGGSSSVTLPAPPRRQAWELVVVTRDRVGNVSRGVRARATSSKFIVG